MQANWLWGFDQFINDITTTRGENMRMKSYAVKIHYSGTNTYIVTAPDYEEAEGAAYDEFQNDIGDLSEYTEVTDTESEPDND